MAGTKSLTATEQKLKNIKIGKSLKKSGMSDEEIKQHTGLTNTDIKKL